MEHAADERDVLTSSREDDEDEVADREYAAGEETQPRRLLRLQTQKTSEASNDHEKVAARSNDRHEEIGPVQATGFKQYADLLQASPDEGRDEQVYIVPKAGNRESCAIAPLTFSTSKDDDGDINKRLQSMQQSNAGIEGG